MSIAALTDDRAAQRWARHRTVGDDPDARAREDADGAPIGPAITWEDDRADPDGERFRAEAGDDDALPRRPASGSTAATCSRWCVGSHARSPVARRTAARILGAKDHLFSRLTGEVGDRPEHGDGVRLLLGARRASWDGTLAADAAPKLPRGGRATSFSRGLRADAAAALGLPAGMPVVLGAADSVCGALGAGASSPGDRVSLWGTSTAIIGVSEELVLDTAHRYLVTPLARGEGWGLEMDLVSTGSAVAWLAGMLGVSRGGALRPRRDVAARRERRVVPPLPRVR